MSTLPLQPLPYDGGLPPPRPKSVTVVAIVGIIFGALGCVCVPAGLIWSHISQSQQGDSMPPAMMTFSTVTSVASLVLSIVLLVGSIGALGLKPWARSALMGFAAVDMVYDVAKAVIFIVWFVPMLDPMLRKQFQANPQMKAQDMERMIKFTTWGYDGCGIVLAVITVGFALWVLIVMSKPSVKAAFEPRAEAMM